MTNHFDDFAFGSKTDAGERTGYLFGMVDGGGTSQVNEFTSNYHVGDDDVAAIGNFGSYKIVRNLSELPAHMMKAVFNVRDSSATKLELNHR